MGYRVLLFRLDVPPYRPSGSKTTSLRCGGGSFCGGSFCKSQDTVKHGLESVDCGRVEWVQRCRWTGRQQTKTLLSLQIVDARTIQHLGHRGRLLGLRMWSRIADGRTCGRMTHRCHWFSYESEVGRRIECQGGLGSREEWHQTKKQRSKRNVVSVQVPLNCVVRAHISSASLFSPFADQATEPLPPDRQVRSALSPRRIQDSVCSRMRYAPVSQICIADLSSHAFGSFTKHQHTNHTNLVTQRALFSVQGVDGLDYRHGWRMFLGRT
jgi:hypothetical protein